MAGGKLGHAICEIPLLQQILSFVSCSYWRSLDCHKVEVYLATLSFGDMTRFIAVVSVMDVSFYTYVV